MREIIIVCIGMFWYDITNGGRFIGNRIELVEYVNRNRYVVSNEISFLDADKFWYNQIKKEA